MRGGARVGLAADLRQAAATADTRRDPEFNRRSRGLLWLIAVAIIPLLLAAIGYGAFDRSRPANGPIGAPPTPVPTRTSGAPKFSLAPLSITRNGNAVTLSGDFPDDSAKAALMKALTDSLPPGVNIIDQVHINPTVDALDFSKAGAVFKDSASILDFSLTVSGVTVTLAGTASQDQKTTVEQEAVHTWSNLNVVGKLVVSAPIPPPPPPALPGPPPPPAPPAVSCADLQSVINAVTGGPITFANDGVSLTPADDQILSQVVDKLKACPGAHVTINGYADNSGSEAISIPLSTQRAQTVADFLLAHGAVVAQLVIKGLGSINPVAPNDTPEGRAKNRRVEIVVS
jgi:peptidoglycan-binding protein ArfA